MNIWNGEPPHIHPNVEHRAHCPVCSPRCDCYVQQLDEETRFSLHLGAHNLKCPVYVESRDPVDFANDEDIRKDYYLERARRGQDESGPLDEED